ncbi:MAG TPA: hypothetical protein VHC45_06275 [Gaiellaceae bacterium]|jgi:hypothetical protein|nr:hypothetical protein [Gaiellaceae bacterium]
MHRLLATAVAVGALAVGASAGAAPVPPFPDVAGSWSHAEINVQVGRQPHTLVLDRGVLTRVSRGRLRIRETDGNVVVMPVARRVTVTSAGGPVPFSFLRAGWSIETMRIDGGAAVRIRIL